MARITSLDVAREAGVSQTTVSFVLNGKNEFGISETTRRLVLDTAQRLGYAPSAVARALRSGRSQVVVFLLADAPVSEPFARFKREVTTALQAQGFTCVFLELTGLAGGVSAVCQHLDPAIVVSATVLPEADKQALVKSGVPVIDGVLGSEDASVAGLDQREIGRMQVRHLADRGHQVIGFAAVDEPQDQPFCLPRLEGAREQCRLLRLAEPVVASMDYSLDGAADALTRWVESEPPVTAVAAFNDVVAVAVLGACRLRGLDVPGDLAIIGVDSETIGALTVPTLTTIGIDLTVPAGSLAGAIVDLAQGGAAQVRAVATDALMLVHRGSS
ncbi:LacI family DNA-binding transcriptional regulator [Nocardia salmonicida]|uniref:LacI family DNA-binding transcriptional regulator n=1 Tax=Nocardia salmonicida TaxID=53431 RepID=UPI002E2E28E0|nr:LacI family DNA-binding transcriptional regulator [Nocardia salmonicida]